MVFECGDLAKILRAAGSGNAHIRDAEARDDGEQLGAGAKALALEQRPRQTRVERQPRHGAAEARDPPIGVQRLQLLEQPIAVAERSRIGRVDEGKTLRLAQPVRGQPQEQSREIRAQYFRFGEGCAGVEVGLRVQPQAKSRT